MNCFKARKWILLHVKADLPARKSRRLEAHLRKCADCRKEIEEARAALAGVQSIAGQWILDWPEAEWKGLMARVKSEQPEPRRRSPLLPVFSRKSWAYGSALLLVLGAVFLTLKFLPSPPPASILTEIRMPTAGRPPRALSTDEAASARLPQDLPFKVYEDLKGSNQAMIAARPDPEKSTQNMMSMIMVSQETGLKVHWTFNRNFDWKEEKK